MKDAPRDERGINRDPVLWINSPASRLPGETSSGGERTRTADFHVANVALYQLSYTPRPAKCTWGIQCSSQPIWDSKEG